LGDACHGRRPAAFDTGAMRGIGVSMTEIGNDLERLQIRD